MNRPQPTNRPRRSFRIFVNIMLQAGVCAMAAIMLTHCGGDEPEDPVAEIKAMIPKLERALNSRAIGDLKGMGTANFQANRIIMEVFGADTGAQAQLSIDRLQFVEEDVVAALHLRLNGQSEPDERLLVLTLVGNGDWEIDSFEVTESELPDSL